MPSFPELIEPLADGEVVVRQAVEHDIPEVLIAYQDDPELHLRLGEERPPSGAELGRMSERTLEDLAGGRRMTLTIARAASDVCLGQVNLLQVDWENARLDLGIWVAPRARGKGLARTALRLVASWLLSEVGFERVQILTETDNDRMLRAARAAGFEYEGVLRQFLREQGSRVDVAVLSLVRRDLTG
ncbi:MAG TPA: GNAT family N-acetyltransferase [Solirubrobacteraceae bacterium]|jgi:RimJ/RimL family protein N-acetyltransferase